MSIYSISKCRNGKALCVFFPITTQPFSVAFEVNVGIPTHLGGQPSSKSTLFNPRPARHIGANDSNHREIRVSPTDKTNSIRLNPTNRYVATDT